MLLNIHIHSTTILLIDSLISSVSFMLAFSDPIISVQPARARLNRGASNSYSKLVNYYYFYSHPNLSITAIIFYLLYYLTLHVVLPEEFIHRSTTVRVTGLQFVRPYRKNHKQKEKLNQMFEKNQQRFCSQSVSGIVQH